MVAPVFDGGQQVAAVGRQYEQVAANQALQPLGTLGAAGDTLDSIWILPVTTTPGGVTIFDNALQLWAFPAGLTLSDTQPIYVPLNLRSVLGAWKVTTGANITVLAIGQWN